MCLTHKMFQFVIVVVFKLLYLITLLSNLGLFFTKISLV